MTDFPIEAFLLNLGVCAAAVILLLAVTLTVSIRRERHDTLDIMWGSGHALIAVISFAMSADHGAAEPRALAMTLTVLWGVRLSIHIMLRNRGSREDFRYAAIRKRAQGNQLRYMLRSVYVIQGGALLFTSLPVQVAHYSNRIPLFLLIAGTVVWLTGFLFETIGDLQLAIFRAGHANQGQVMDRGLWRYTRHPNYFGDMLVWWGLFLLACQTWVGLATIISPITMTFLLVRKTGKPLMEQHMRSTYVGYAEYITRTSGFLPLPPRTSM